jgi:hypothetical protein
MPETTPTTTVDASIGDALRAWLDTGRKVVTTTDRYNDAKRESEAAIKEHIGSRDNVKAAIEANGTNLKQCGPNGLVRFEIDTEGGNAYVEVQGGDVRLMEVNKV